MFNKAKDNHENKVLEPFEDFVRNRAEDIKKRYEDADKYFDISKKVDEMSKYTTTTSKDEYEMLYLKDTTYERLIKERELFIGILEEFIAEVKSNELSIDDRLLKIIYVKEKLQPILDDLDSKINQRKNFIDNSVKQFVEESSNKKNRFKAALYGVAVLGVGAVCVMNPKAREYVKDITKAIGKSKDVL